MVEKRVRTPITKKDIRAAKKRAKITRASKMSAGNGNNSGSNKKKIFIIAGIGVAVIAIIGMALFIITQKEPSEEEMLLAVDQGVFASTTTIEGVDVSGKTITQAKEVLSPALEAMFLNTEFTYEIQDESFAKNAYELGLITNIEDILIDAMLYEKTGNVFERSEKLKILETEGQSFNVDLIALPDNVANASKKFLPLHGVLPIEPTMEFNPDGKTEEEYFMWTDEMEGFAVSEAAFVSMAVEKITAKNYNFGQVETDIIAPEKTKEEMATSVVKLSEYTTFYGTGELDDDNRMANIVKMSNMLSGSVVKPGETWSINETTGERTKDEGWKVGHSIRRGVMVDELGGGVCQVSSTLYNAVLEADVGIVERHNHTIKSVYVFRKTHYKEDDYPDHEAADATIDYPRKDFKIQNVFNEDIYIIIVPNTDRGVKNLTAMIFGPKPENDYKIVIRTIEDKTKTPKPSAEPTLKVAKGGLMPDGTHVKVGFPRAYPKASDGSVWYTYKYYYPKDYDVKEDETYSWIGYEEGDRNSGEKYRIKTVDGDYLDSIYPAQNGVTYYNPEDPESYGLDGSTYDPNAVVEGEGEVEGEGNENDVPTT